MFPGGLVRVRVCPFCCLRTVCLSRFAVTWTVPLYTFYRCLVGLSRRGRFGRLLAFKCRFGPFPTPHIPPHHHTLHAPHHPPHPSYHPTADAVAHLPVCLGVRVSPFLRCGVLALLRTLLAPYNTKKRGNTHTRTVLRAATFHYSLFAGDASLPFL